MSNKRFDFSVLPDGFLIEQEWHEVWEPKFKSRRSGRHSRIRPALIHWHFIDLDVSNFERPEGLICICRPHEGEDVACLSRCGYFESKVCAYDYMAMSAFMVIGAHPDYAEHAKELGMPVVEL